MTNLFDIPEAPAKCSAEEFKAYWNAKTDLPKIVVMNNDRMTKLRLRLKMDEFAKNWKHIVDVIAEKPEFHGKNNSGWIATVDFLLRNDINWVRVLEKYPIGQKTQPQKSKWAIARERSK